MSGFDHGIPAPAILPVCALHEFAIAALDYDRHTATGSPPCDAARIDHHAERDPAHRRPLELHRELREPLERCATVPTHHVVIEEMEDPHPLVVEVTKTMV